MKYFIETSWRSLNHYGEELCGDKVEVTKSDQGILMVLSDGLGSGVKANILASLTSKIIASMVNAGADIKDVVETIASTLPVCRERQVAYSTFTMMQVDKEGNAYFVEFDNPSLILLRDGKRIFVPWTERTIAGKQIREARMKLQLHDIAVTFSDGVTHAGVGQVLNFGWQHDSVVKFLEENSCPDDKASDVQLRLLNHCNQLYEGKCGDDTTVAALRVCNPVPCCIMVGPPVNPEDDMDVVNDLMTCPGVRVICGGTTSQIVSRLIDKPLTIDLQYFSPDVPPIAHMEGVDLVTEGVVTIGRVLDILEDYAANPDPEKLTVQKDAAHLLAEILLEKCTSVKFICGRALNPAHQNPDMPISLSIKLRLVKDIANCLRKMGKPVTIRYC
ncbi:MAG: SpoIIE family protein phosphatase [Clostridia bacterium]|nr:SpoIIE family protein phosphatase [Clostridia bacterium]